MRVLVVHGRYRSVAPSGENHVVDQEREVLCADGHVVDRFERDSDDIAEWSAVRKALIPGRAVRNGEARRELRRALLSSQPDIVHVHNTFPLLSASVLLACRDVGVPVVATIHNYKLLCAGGDFFRNGAPCHTCAKGGALSAVFHGCYRGSRVATLPVVLANKVNRHAWRTLVSAYIFVSAAQRDLMAGLELPEERVFVKHNFVPMVPNPLRDPQHVVAYLGRLDAAKGLPLLMRAWDMFRSQHPQSALRLVVAGGGPMDAEVRAWAGRDPTVDVVGLLSRGAANALLARALVAVVPSQWEETFGLVAVEAMAAGVAPVAPAHGSFPEIVHDGVDGVLFRPGDPRSLAAALATADRDAEHFIELGRNGRVTCEERFGSAANVKQLLHIYRYALDNPVGRP
jgi:glycosyltransferase involved in cell wall biosynthesis